MFRREVQIEDRYLEVISILMVFKFMVLCEIIKLVGVDGEKGRFRIEI